MPHGRAWRGMSELDLPQVFAVAELVHTAYPEDLEVFAERLRLYPGGCHVLVDHDGRVMGYAISHPWIYGSPPELNTLLHELPEPATTYFIHDIVVLPEARSGGMGSQIVKTIIDHARTTGMENISLVSVNRSEPFWKRHGFRVRQDQNLDRKLKSYDPEAAFMVRSSHAAISGAPIELE